MTLKNSLTDLVQVVSASLLEERSGLFTNSLVQVTRVWDGLDSINLNQFNRNPCATIILNEWKIDVDLRIIVNPDYATR
jgi:hypothetical protein